MNRRILKDSYLTINLVFAGIIVIIIGYSCVFKAEGNHYPIPSGAALFSKESTISSGLSRSFSAIVRFNFKEAATFNPFGLRIFSFFFIQLFMRAMVSALLLKGNTSYRKAIVLADALVSVSLFVLLFWPFIEAGFFNFLKHK